MMLRSLQTAALALFVFALAAGCDQPPLCARVVCSNGGTCNPKSGLCDEPDAGKDGGSDAGGGGGGSGNCDPACTNDLVCDPNTDTCVQCVDDSQCACPTPVCGSNRTCVAGTPDGGDTQLLGESCDEPAPLVFPGCGTSASFHLDLSMLADDESGSCNAPMSQGRDAVFSLKLSATQDVVVHATSSGNGSDPVIYLRTSPCETGTELGCVDSLGSVANLTVKSLPAGTYYLVIDAYDDGSSGGVDLDVELQPPTLPANETCGTAIPASLDGGTVSVDLSTATDDTEGSCSPSGVSPEAVYSVSLATPADLHLSVAPNAGGEAVVYVRGTPCVTGTELICLGPTSGTATSKLRALEAGDYWIFVESPLATAGTVSLTSWTTPATAPPPNDTCASPRLLTFQPGSNSVTLPVDPSDGNDDYTASCNTVANSPELVYQLHLNASSAVSLDLAPLSSGSVDPVLYLRTTPCDFPSVIADAIDAGITDGGFDAGTELGCSHVGGGGTDHLAVQLSAGDYFIYVEGAGLSGAGASQLTVTVQ